MHPMSRVKPTTETVVLFDVAPCSDEDAAWAAQAFATDTFRMDNEIDPDCETEPDWDALEWESRAVDRLCNGYAL